jgi:hypothetical protein
MCRKRGFNKWFNALKINRPHLKYDKLKKKMEFKGEITVHIVEFNFFFAIKIAKYNK